LPITDFTVPNRIFDYMAQPRASENARFLGIGGSGKVRLEWDRDTREYVAVKSSCQDKLDKHIVVGEVEALANLNHPCVLRIVEFCFPNGSSCAQIHTECAATGSLPAIFTRLKYQPPGTFWNATRIGIILCGIALGMRYIHQDLNPSNVLITEDWRARVGDFGSSRFVNDAGTPTGATRRFTTLPRSYSTTKASAGRKLMSGLLG
jgi:serine/threonine protein kinase